MAAAEEAAKETKEEEGASGRVVNTIHYCHDAFITIVVPLLSIRSKGFPSTVPTRLTLGKTTSVPRARARQRETTRPLCLDRYAYV